MKKSFRILLAAFAVLVAVHSAFALEATVLSTSGKVEIQKGSSWIPLSKGDVVSSGAVISTGFKSSAELSIQGSKVQLGPLTRITIEKLVSSSSKTETSIYLDSGKIDASVNKSDGKRTGFRVSTPVATASVRGTSFSINAEGFLSTDKGLVAKMPSKSKAPQVSDVPSDFVPGDGKTNAFTSVKNVSGGLGIPVYEGDSSSTDSATGLPVYPQKELARKVVDIHSGTGSQAFLERIASPAAGAPTSASYFPEPGAPFVIESDSSSSGESYGNLVVTVSY